MNSLNVYEAMVGLVVQGNVRGARELLEGAGLTEAQKLGLMEEAKFWMVVHEQVREELIVSADNASPDANRKAMAEACDLARPTIYAIIDRRRGQRDRRPPRH